MYPDAYIRDTRKEIREKIAKFLYFLTAKSMKEDVLKGYKGS
jgi:hypothetical protein